MKQTRSIELPSDSHFAIAVKSKREAERAEQQRIKNLVLNYDLQESNADQSGIDDHLCLKHFSQPNPNLKNTQGKPPKSGTFAHNNLPKGPDGMERHANSHHQPNSSQHHQTSSSADRPGANRNAHRARKLQLSDVDWQDQKPSPFQRGSGRGNLHRTNG